MKKTPKNVESYISSAPIEIQDKLKELRAAIREVAPAAIERISYGMPYYDYNGRLAYFRLAKVHIGLYIPPPIIEEHKRDLKKYKTTKATIRFPIQKPLPLRLIKKLIKAKMKRNEKQRQ